MRSPNWPSSVWPGCPTLQPLLWRNRVVPGATGPERIPGRNARIFKQSQDFLTERAGHVADDAVEASGVLGVAGSGEEAQLAGLEWARAWVDSEG
jgi:hypothetical protein